MIAAILYLLAAVGAFLAARALDRWLAVAQELTLARMRAPEAATVDREGSVWVPTERCYCGALPAGEACDACLDDLGLLRSPESGERLREAWRATHGRGGAA
jgi:hypothetical protein